MPLYQPVTASSSGQTYLADLLTGNDSLFTASLGNWTNSGGTLTRSTTSAYRATGFAASLKFVTTASGQYATVPVAGTFLSGVRYDFMAWLKVEETGTFPGDQVSLILGLQGTDTASAIYTVSDDAGFCGATGYFVVVWGSWKPSADRTGVTLRFNRHLGTATISAHLGYVRVATVANAGDPGLIFTVNPVDSSAGDGVVLPQNLSFGASDNAFDPPLQIATYPGTGGYIGLSSRGGQFNEDLDGTNPTADHLTDATDAHDASAISFDDSGLGITAADVQTMGEQLDAAISAGGIPATIFDAAGDLIVASAADTAARLAMGSALQVLRVNAGATALEYAAPSAGTPAFAGAKAYHNTTQSINGTAMFALNSEEWDTSTFHDTSTNNSRFTCATAGYYLVQGGSFAGATVDWIACYINGSIVRGTATFGRAAAGYFSASWIVHVTAGQYIEIGVATSGAVTFGHASLVDAQTWGAVTFMGA